MTGQLHALNKGAFDWGWQGLLAYGCHSCVVVVDPSTVQVIVIKKHFYFSSFQKKMSFMFFIYIYFFIYLYFYY